MSNNISLRQLRYFDALAQCLHFGRAAELCAVSQPALSMQIQELEKEIGAVLIERTRQGAKLTEAGQEAARRVSSILADLHDLVASAKQSGAALDGTIRLGVIPTIAPYVLPRLLPFLRAHFPGLDLHLREAQTHLLAGDVASARLDAALLSLPLEHAEIETLSLFDDPFVLAVPDAKTSPHHLAATPELFENERLLLLEEGHCLRDQALSFCSLKQAGNINTLGTQSLSTLAQMVANGLGVTLLPAMSLETELRHGGIRILNFEPPLPRRDIGIAWRRSSPRKQDFAALGDAIIAVMA